MRKERSSNDPSSPELMRRLLESFGNNNWECDQYWVNNKGEFYMSLESKKNSKEIIFQQTKTGTEKEETYLSFAERGLYIFEFHQKTGVSTIKNEIIYWPRSEFAEVKFKEDGSVEPKNNIKGLPKKIDFNATATAFIEQVIAGKFGHPKLIKPQK